MAYSVLVADDHPIVRQGLRGLIEAEQDFKLVGEASNGLDAVLLASRYKPNILVLDLVLPGLHGLEVIRQVKDVSPATRVIILSMHSNTAHVFQALKNGAAGYLVKETGPEELISALREVVKGERYLSPSISKTLLDMLIEKTNDQGNDNYGQLSDREREVLQLAAEGLTNTEIGERLSISPRTVERHRFNVMEKLSLHSQTDLIRFALKRGILPMD